MLSDPWHLVDLDGDLPSAVFALDVELQHADGCLCIQALADHELGVPDLPTDLPLPSAMAALANWSLSGDALLRLRQPAAVIDAGSIPLLDGIRLIDIDTPGDRALWDAALDAGMQCFGSLRHCLHRGDDLLQALRFGDFLACDGDAPLAWSDDHRGADWRLREGAAQARVIVRGGMEAALIDGCEGSWRDRGGEGWVRIELEDRAGCSFSQPRLVAARAG